MYSALPHKTFLNLNLIAAGFVFMYHWHTLFAHCIFQILNLPRKQNPWQLQVWLNFSHHATCLTHCCQPEKNWFSKIFFLAFSISRLCHLFDGLHSIENWVEFFFINFWFFLKNWCSLFLLRCYTQHQSPSCIFMTSIEIELQARTSGIPRYKVQKKKSSLVCL